MAISSAEGRIMQDVPTHSQKVLLGLLYAIDKPLVQFKRLKLALYALRALSGYRFPERCFLGPDDSRFREDLDILSGTGFIKAELVRPPNFPVEPAHTSYSLTSHGYYEARKFMISIRSRSQERIGEVARYMGENIPAARLYDQFVVQ